MNFILNEIDTEGIREDTFRGRDYLVAPVTAMKAMDLDGGYVPKEHVKNSVPSWNGTPVTLNHPVTPDGERVSANSPNVADKVWLGYFFNAESVNDGERLDGEVWLDIAYAEDRGNVTEDIHENIREGDAYPTSTAYYGDKLAEGEYDGEFRENAVGNLKPDHLALLTSTDGRCSVDDGCMIGSPALNSEKLTEVADSFNSSETSDVHEFLHDSMFETVENANSVEGMNYFPNEVLINREDEGESMGDPEELGEEAAESFISQVTNYFSVETMTERQEMIDVLANEHDFKEDSLEGMGDTCLERTFEAFENEEEETETEETEVTVEANDIAETVNEKLDEKFGELDEKVEETVEEKLAANQEAQKREDLIDEIVTNSEDYEEEDLQETPVGVLENLIDTLDTGSADWSASPGAEARNSDNEELPPLSMSEVDE